MNAKLPWLTQLFLREHLRPAVGAGILESRAETSTQARHVPVAIMTDVNRRKVSDCMSYTPDHTCPQGNPLRSVTPLSPGHRTPNLYRVRDLPLQHNTNTSKTVQNESEQWGARLRGCGLDPCVPGRPNLEARPPNSSDDSRGIGAFASASFVSSKPTARPTTPSAMMDEWFRLRRASFTRIEPINWRTLSYSDGSRPQSSFKITIMP